MPAYPGRRSANELLTRLRNAPVAATGDLQADAHRSAVAGLVSALAPIVAQISQLTSQIAGAVRAHPDGPIFLSFFKDPKSVLTAGGLLAEIGDNRARYPTRDSLAADAGQAPVAKRIGQAPPRHLPLGLRQTPAQPLRHPRRQHPPLAPLGPRRLHPRHQPRLHAPPRHPHPRPRMEPHHLALLARPPALQPPQHGNLTQLLKQQG